MADEKKVEADNKATVDKVVIEKATKEAVEKRDLQEAGANPLTIPWPQDPQGALRELKRGGTAAASRIKGDKGKLKRFQQSLRLLAQHAKALYDRDTESRDAARTNAVNAHQRVQERLHRQAVERAKAHQRAAQRVLRDAGIKGGAED